MARYLLRRIISGLIVLFMFVSVLFFAVQAILPGDFVGQYSLQLSPDEAQEVRELLGLDMTLWQQYLNWLSRLLRGDLGFTYTWRGPGSPVLEIIKETLPPTILVFGLGTVMAFLLDQWLGKVTAWRGPGFLSGSVTFSAIMLYTAFPPWLAFLLIHFTAGKLGFLSQSLTLRPMWRLSDVSQTEVMIKMIIGLITVLIVILSVNNLLRRLLGRRLPLVISLPLIIAGWVVSWYWYDFVPLATDILRQAALPILAYTLLSFGEIMVIMRTSMTDTLNEAYVQTARAKGLPDRVVRDQHAARNALLPVISKLVTGLPFLLTGLVMIEKTIGWTGVGTTLFYAVGMQNVTLLLGMIIAIGVFSLITRVILDIIIAALDPRVRIKPELSGIFQ